VRTRALSNVTLAWLLVASGCGDGEPAPTFVTRDSAGITIVESSAPEWGEEEGWRVAARPLVTIGSVGGPEEEQLYQVRGVLRLDDGRIVVGNAGSHQLRFYSADGSYHSAAGRSGSGPGEFDTIMWLWRRGDSIVVYDMQQGNRMSVFTVDGAFVRSFVLRQTADARIPLDADPFFTGEVLVLVSPRRTLSSPGLYAERDLFLAYSADGEPGDTVGWLPGEETYLTSVGGGSVFGFRRPYGLASQRAMGRAGVYFGSSETYEIGLYTAHGTILERLVRRPIPNPQLTDMERSEYRREWEEEYGRSRHTIRALLDMVELPETKPAYGRLLVDAADNLWVAQYRRRREDLDRWDVFDAEGRWFGTVHTPTGLVIYEIGTDYILGSQRDDLDVEYVQLYGLEKGRTW
jgi:hypothetical protein